MAYARFFGKTLRRHEFKELVIDDHPLCPILVTDLGGRGLQKLELHFPRSMTPYQHPFLTEPVSTRASSDRDADTVRQICYSSPTLTILHLDMQYDQLQRRGKICFAIEVSIC